MNRESSFQLRIVLTVWMLILLQGTAAQGRPAPQPVDLQFNRTDIQVVLDALASSVGFNLVVGPNVDGEIDVHLSGVDWETALNTIVDANGFRYFWSDDVLVVLSGGDDAAGGLAHRVIRLRYADPDVIQAALTNVLSAQGKIQLVEPAAEGVTAEKKASHSELILTEAPHLIDKVANLIDSLDVPLPQFEIEVKLVETDVDDNMDAGFNWPTRVSATVADYESRPTPAAEYPIPDGKIWRFGTLSINQLNGFIDFLRQKGHARILSDPRVTVLENEKATMQVTTTIPVQTLNRFTEGAIIQDIVDFQDLDVGITLTVTPRLNDNEQITLDVEPVIEEITGYTGPADNQRPITAKRRVKTSVRVNNGETLVIGGLVKETKFTTKNRVFLLGSIPILGNLFTHTSRESKKTDLLIFITPRILTATE
jgi:type II secretory pathway component GspD/PulD (secretin)